MMYRQGDLLLVTLPVPPTFKQDIAATEAHSMILAMGNITGHNHVLHGRAIYYGMTGFLYLIEPGELRHQRPDGSQADHDSIQLSPNWYRKYHQYEYVEPTRVSAPRRRRVAD